MAQSVCPSVRPSVCGTILLFYTNKNHKELGFETWQIFSSLNILVQGDIVNLKCFLMFVYFDEKVLK